MDIKVADEVWVATALLHREQPSRTSFRNREIVERVEREGIHGRLRPGIQVHVSVHCVANKPPNPGTYRMLFETPDGGRRLYRPGDPAHPARSGKMVPARDDLPSRYHHLLVWYRTVFCLTPDRPGRSPRAAVLGEFVAERETVGYTAAPDERTAAPMDPLGDQPSAGTLEWQDHIVADGSVLLGKPVVKGTRLAVEFIVELMAYGWTTEEILRNYPGLSSEHLRACLAYSVEHLRAQRVYPLHMSQA
jgi:uncharacterized protein (DUF433 family)